MAMSKKLTMDISFNFEGDTTSIDGIIGNGENGICNACKRRYKHHDIPVPFAGWRGAEYGPEFAEEGVHYGFGVLCADCILSSPAELAAKFRALAEEILRRPITHRNQRAEADGMIELADELVKVGDLRDLPGGIMATKIAEAYRELDNRPNVRKRKAA
jgi:hypothetical protein